MRIAIFRFTKCYLLRKQPKLVIQAIGLLYLASFVTYHTKFWLESYLLHCVTLLVIVSYFTVCNWSYLMDLLLGRTCFIQNGILQAKEFSRPEGTLILTVYINGENRTFKVYEPLAYLFFRRPIGSKLSFRYLRNTRIVFTDDACTEQSRLPASLAAVCGCNSVYRQLDEIKKQQYYKAAFQVVKEFSMPTTVLFGLVIPMAISVLLFGYGFKLAGKISIPVGLLLSILFAYMYLHKKTIGVLAGLSAYTAEQIRVPKLFSKGSLAAFSSENVPQIHKRRVFLELFVGGEWLLFQCMRKNTLLPPLKTESGNLEQTVHAVVCFANSHVAYREPVNIILALEDAV